MSDRRARTEGAAKSQQVKRAAYAPLWGTFFMIVAPLFFAYGAYLVIIPTSGREMIEMYAMGKARETSGEESMFWLEVASGEEKRIKAIAPDSSISSWNHAFTQYGQKQNVSVVWAVAVAVFLLGRRLRRKPAAASLGNDEREPILFLRPFSVDAASTITNKLESRERHLVDVLADLAPVLAIGRPGDTLPTLGANRVFVSHEQWKDAVRVFLEGARLVLIQIGGTPGILWELSRVRELLEPERLVLFFDTPGPTPDLQANVARALQLSQFPSATAPFLIVFDRAWNPRVIERKAVNTSFRLASSDDISSQGALGTLRSELATKAKATPERRNEAARHRVRDLVQTLDDNAEVVALPQANLFVILLAIALAGAVLLMPHSDHGMEGWMWTGRVLEVVFGITAGLAAAFWVWSKWPEQRNRTTLAWSVVLGADLAWVAFVQWPGMAAETHFYDVIDQRAASIRLTNEIDSLKTNTGQLRDRISSLESRALINGVSAEYLDSIQTVLDEYRSNLVNERAARKRHIEDPFVANNPDTAVVRIARALAGLSELRIQNADSTAALFAFLKRTNGRWHQSRSGTFQLRFDSEGLQREYAEHVNSLQRSAKRIQRASAAL